MIAVNDGPSDCMQNVTLFPFLYLVNILALCVLQLPTEHSIVVDVPTIQDRHWTGYTFLDLPKLSS